MSPFGRSKPDFYVAGDNARYISRLDDPHKMWPPGSEPSSPTFEASKHLASDLFVHLVDFSSSLTRFFSSSPGHCFTVCYYFFRVLFFSSQSPVSSFLFL